MDETTLDRSAEGVARASWRAWLGLAVLTLTLFMAALDMTVVFLALPAIAADLLPGATQQLWVLHVGDIVGAGLVLTAGRLADRFGPRLLLTVTLLGYGAASLLAAFATSVEMLIVARGLLGASAIAFGPAGMILIRRMFPDGRQFALAVGIFMAAFSGGMALGPPIGGILLNSFDWGAVFLVNVPVAVLALAALRILPAVAPQGGGRIDLVSVLLSISAVGLFVYGVQELAADGPAGHEVVAVLVGLLLGALFVRRQRRLTEPLLDPALFASRNLVLATLAMVGVILATAGADMQFAQHLQVAEGLSALHAGLVLIVPATLAVVGTVVAPMLLRWFTPAQIMGVGVLLAAAGAITAALAIGWTPQGEVTAMVAGIALMDAGIAPVFGLGAGLIVASAPPGRTGSAAAVQDIGGSLGNSFAFMIGGTISFVIYQALLVGRLPAGLSADDERAVTDSVGAAVATAQQLPSAPGAQLAEAATSAFSAATQALFALAAVLLVGVAAVVLIGLRRARMDDDSAAASH